MLKIEDEDERELRARILRSAMIRVFDLFDPAGIVYREAAREQYDIEVDAMLPQLKDRMDLVDVRQLERRIFRQYFAALEECLPSDEGADDLGSVLYLLWKCYSRQIAAIDRFETQRETPG